MSFWDCLNKANKVMGTVAAGTALVGAVSAGVGLFAMSRRKQKRKEINEDREYELHKENLQANIELKNREMDLKAKQLESDERKEAMKYNSEVARTQIMYSDNKMQPNYVKDDLNNTVMDNRRIKQDVSIMSTGLKTYNPSSNNVSNISSIQSELLKLFEMKQNGIINDQEFQMLKAKCING